MLLNSIYIDNNSAATTDYLNTNLDLQECIINNLTITSSVEVKLAIKSDFIEDNFNDESKINSKNDLIIDTIKGEISSEKIENTFSKPLGGTASEWGSCRFRYRCYVSRSHWSNRVYALIRTGPR